MSRSLTPEEKKLVRDHMTDLEREAQEWVEADDRRIRERREERRERELEQKKGGKK